MIIAFHYTFKGGFDFSSGGVFLNKIIFDVVYYFGEWGVNLFILISGYFLTDTIYKKEKLLCIILETLFYIILCRAILVHLHLAQWSQWRILDFMFPILLPKYWFVTAYVLIYLISPYLKVMVEHINQKEFIRLLVLWFAIWSFFPTVIQGYLYGGTDIEATQNYNRFIWLIGIYLCGCYFRIRGVPKALDSLRSRGIFLVSVCVSLLLYILAIESGINIGGKSAVYFWTPNSIIEVALSISLFLFFEKIHISYIPIINAIASCTLGIYMIHDGELVSVWWGMVFKNASHQNSRFFLIHIGIAVAVIMTVGICCEYIRKIIENKIVLPTVRKYLK